MSLSVEQIRFFRHNGFLKLPTLLPPCLVLVLKEAIDAEIRAEKSPLVRDAQGRVVRISDLWGRGGVFQEALTSPCLLEPLTALIGENIELVLNRHNHATLRLAGDGSAYFHRDVLQWTRTIVTALFYLEETHLENGCTQIIPGSHLQAEIQSTNIGDNTAIRDSGILEQTLPVPMPAGGILVMDSLLIHSVGENRTTGTRTSMTVGYHSVDELSEVPNSKRVLVRGERIYKGNS